MIPGLARLLFSLKHRTLGRVALSPGAETVRVFYQGGELELPRRCRHQGGPLEQGWVEADCLVCPWHGCRTSLKAAARRGPTS